MKIDLGIDGKIEIPETPPSRPYDPLAPITHYIITEDFDDYYGGNNILFLLRGPQESNIKKLYYDYQNKLREDYKLANKKWRKPNDMLERFVQWLTIQGFVHLKFEEVQLN